MPFEIFSACQEADEDGQGKDDHLTTDDQTSHYLAGSSGLSLVGWIMMMFSFRYSAQPHTHAAWLIK